MRQQGKEDAFDFRGNNKTTFIFIGAWPTGDLRNSGQLHRFQNNMSNYLIFINYDTVARWNFILKSNIKKLISITFWWGNFDRIQLFYFYRQTFFELIAALSMFSIYILMGYPIESAIFPSKLLLPQLYNSSLLIIPITTVFLWYIHNKLRCWLVSYLLTLVEMVRYPLIVFNTISL